MRVLRDSQIITGFIYEDPVDEFPALTHCGAALCCRGHQRPRHAHPGFEFLYVSRGSCFWQVAGRTYRQTMGSLFVAWPDEAHSTGPIANPENRHLWLGLRLSELGPSGIWLAQEIQRRSIHLLRGCEGVEPLLQAIISQVTELRPRRSEAIAALLHAFIELMIQRISLIDSGRDMQPVRSALPYSFSVQKAITYMQQNLDRRLELREFGAVAAIRSVPHFCTKFRQEVGISPSAYHMQLRLEAAREVLHQPSVDITSAALEFGFSSSQHFSTLFRRAFGLTPRQWKVREGAASATGNSPVSPGLDSQRFPSAS